MVFTIFWVDLEAVLSLTFRSSHLDREFRSEIWIRRHRDGFRRFSFFGSADCVFSFCSFFLNFKTKQSIACRTSDWQPVNTTHCWQSAALRSAVCVSLVPNASFSLTVDMRQVRILLLAYNFEHKQRVGDKREENVKARREQQGGHDPHHSHVTQLANIEYCGGGDEC